MQSFFDTADFALATTLLCHGFTVETINNINPQRVVFSFLHTAKLNEVVQRYWSRNLAVEPQLFTFNQKFLKSMIYQK